MTDTMSRMGLHDFFIDGLEEIYDAEKRFMKCFAALGLAAVSKELQHALISHGAVTEKHLGHLEAILDRFHHQPGAGTCLLVENLTDKASGMIRRIETGTALRDVAIFCLVKVIQHYKIAIYSSLVSLSAEMKHSKVTVLLEECLSDEKDIEEYLTKIAGDFIGPAAKDAGLK